MLMAMPQVKQNITTASNVDVGDAVAARQVIMPPLTRPRPKTLGRWAPQLKVHLAHAKNAKVEKSN